jgi:hypothetical protein
VFLADLGDLLKRIVDAGNRLEIRVDLECYLLERGLVHENEELRRVVPERADWMRDGGLSPVVISMAAIVINGDKQCGCGCKQIERPSRGYILIGTI